jgi:SIR2-like domain/NACHT domain
LHGDVYDYDGMIFTAEDYDAFYSSPRTSELLGSLWRTSRLLVIGFGFRDPFLTRGFETSVRSLQIDVRHYAFIGVAEGQTVSEIDRQGFARKYRISPIFYTVGTRPIAEGSSTASDHSRLVELLRHLSPRSSSSALASAKGQVTTAVTPRISRATLDWNERDQLLETIEKYIITPRLRLGLRGAIRIALDIKETIPFAINLSVFGLREIGVPTERRIGEKIDEIFDKALRQRVLIIGEPGTGKSNLLYELAEALASAAKADPSRPVPIVFGLARWASGERTRTLSEWMMDDLQAWYGLSTPAANSLLAEGGIIPLLDGLDEVAEARRALCVEAISRYQHERSDRSYAITCRLEDYNRLHTKLEVGAIVRIEKLSVSDVNRETAKPGLEHVREALDCHHELYSLVTTPLWLHVLYFAAQIPASRGDGLTVATGYTTDLLSTR